MVGNPSGSAAILYIQREKGGRGLLSIEECKVTKIKAAVKLYRNGDRAMAMIREFEESAKALGDSSLVKEAARYAEEMGLRLQLEYPNPTCVNHDSGKGLRLQLEYPNPTCVNHDSGKVITAEKLKTERRGCLRRSHWMGCMNRTGRGN